MFGHTPFQFTGNARAIRLAAERDEHKRKDRTQTAPVTADTKEGLPANAPDGLTLTQWALRRANRT